MASSFGGLGIGVSAIAAHQRALDVTGHNISNVNTPGYTRQAINNAASLSDTVGRTGSGQMMQIGTGVEVTEIKQLRDEFLDRKIKRENCELGYWESRQTSINELETVFNDNTEEGLQSVMDNFWNSWEQLSKPTGGLTARALVKESAMSFIETVQYMDNTLNNYKKNKDTEIRESVKRVNEIAKQIANLNMEIKKVEAYGVTANDYRDQRESLIDELSKMAKIQVVNTNTVNIAIEGRLLVEDNKYEQIMLTPDPDMGGLVQLNWSDTKEPLQISGGSIKSLFESRDELVNGLQDKLNEFVRGVATEINAIHIQGFGIKDGVRRNFFVNELDGSGDNINVQNIALNPDLNDFDNIAAGGSYGNAEDNTIALQIASLRQQDAFSDNKYETDTNLRKYNFDEYYRNIISDIGNKGQEAATAASAQQQLVEQLEYKRQSIGAVSLDEEMSNLIKFEHSYNSAARVVNAMDEMLDMIINKTGLSGRS